VHLLGPSVRSRKKRRPSLKAGGSNKTYKKNVIVTSIGRSPAWTRAEAVDAMLDRGRAQGTPTPPRRTNPGAAMRSRQSRTSSWKAAGMALSGSE
jgi:hypothetical protein